jgi:hypothetical protein
MNERSPTIGKTRKDSALESFQQTMKDFMPNLHVIDISKEEMKRISLILIKYFQENDFSSDTTATLISNIPFLGLPGKDGSIISDGLIEKFMKNEQKTVKSVGIFLRAISHPFYKKLEKEEILRLSSVITKDGTPCLDVNDYTYTLYGLTGLELKWDELSEKLRRKYLNDYETIKEQLDDSSWSLIYFDIRKQLLSSPSDDSDRLKEILADLITRYQESHLKAGELLVNELLSSSPDTSTNEMIEKLIFRLRTAIHRLFVLF